ncbi:MAG: peptidoglycan DD-metalloendopeptidase family protein [Desulfocapsaceae bacterium]|jgi:septal ring factor EnvC (AmiA/AmiB activator)|nr:peptidoglycan DD-metalloendopeptidase family protein [Desulfocapsaceae bacterium]
MRDRSPSPLFPAALYRSLACLCCLLLLVPAPEAWSTPRTDLEKEKARIEERIKRHQINIGRLEQGIDNQQDDIEKSRNQERELLAELQEIDTRLSEHREKLDVLEERIGAQRTLIVTKNNEIDAVQARKNNVQLHLQKRIQAYYKMGNIGFINVTFSARSLPELLNFNESFQTLIKYDQDVIVTYRQTIKQLQKSVETLEIEEALLEDFIERNKEEQQKIQLVKEEKEELLYRIKTQSQLHEKAIAELEQAAQSLTASLQKLEQKEEQFEQTFLYSKGRIPPPVTGTLVSGFQEEVTNRLGITAISQGIAIKAANGSIVRAIHDGVVTFAGYLRGYGNTVIVNHGHQYYSICSRIERIVAEKGQNVAEGSELGIMGDTATLMNEGLYFEIRKDSTPLPPLEWIDASTLQREK